MNIKDDRHTELGAFLRARRGEVTPDEVGLSNMGQPRRVHGLRREEVAQLAAISVDYYIRLEQGRLGGASRSTLNAIARALRLNGDQTNYLYQLANKVGSGQDIHAPQHVRPETQQLLDNLRDTPAIVLGRHMDILAWNALAATIYTDFATIPIEKRNFVGLAFLDPKVRGVYADWSSVARICVAFLRMGAAQFPDDPRLIQLVDELTAKDENFRQWWGFHDVATTTFGIKRFLNPAVGELTLNWQMLTCTHDPQQTIFFMTAQPGSLSHKALQRLST